MNKFGLFIKILYVIQRNSKQREADSEGKTALRKSWKSAVNLRVEGGITELASDVKNWLLNSMGPAE